MRMRRWLTNKTNETALGKYWKENGIAFGRRDAKLWFNHTAAAETRKKIWIFFNCMVDVARHIHVDTPVLKLRYNKGMALRALRSFANDGRKDMHCVSEAAVTLHTVSVETAARCPVYNRRTTPLEELRHAAVGRKSSHSPTTIFCPNRYQQ